MPMIRLLFTLILLASNAATAQERFSIFVGSAQENVDRMIRLADLRDVGATAVTCSVSTESSAHYCAQLDALKELSDDL